MRTTIRLRGSRIGASALTLTRKCVDKSAAATAAWNGRMQEQAAAETVSGTRWGRGLGVIGASGAAVGMIGYSIAGGAVAASFNVADHPLTAHIDEVDGTGLAAVMSAVKSKRPDGKSDPVGTLHAAISQGSLKGSASSRRKRSSVSATRLSSRPPRPAPGRVRTSPSMRPRRKGSTSMPRT